MQFCCAVTKEAETIFLSSGGMKMKVMPASGVWLLFADTAAMALALQGDGRSQAGDTGAKNCDVHFFSIMCGR